MCDRVIYIRFHQLPGFMFSAFERKTVSMCGRLILRDSPERKKWKKKKILEAINDHFLFPIIGVQK